VKGKNCKMHQPLLQDILETGQTLSQLIEEAGRCELCPIHAQRKKCALHRGIEDAPVLILSEKSGMQETNRGMPFAGASGKELESLMHKAGLFWETNCRATNLVICPIPTRAPKSQELKNCQWWRKVIARQRPRLIIALGRQAINALNVSNDTSSVSALNGKIIEWQGIPVICGYNPAYLLRAKKEQEEVYKKAINPWLTTIKKEVAKIRRK
jgi:uracil-DNA glycosylase